MLKMFLYKQKQAKVNVHAGYMSIVLTPVIFIPDEYSTRSSDVKCTSSTAYVQVICGGN